MPSFSLEKKSKRFLLWGLPVLAVVCLILFTLIPRVIEQQYQATIRRGWSIQLERQELVRSSYQSTDILAADTADRIWVAGLGEGLQFSEGEDWDSRAGEYADLTIDPGGKVWAVRYRGYAHTGLDVFDGQRWTSYESRDFGLDDQRIAQVEISSDGRVFISTESRRVRIFEIVNQDKDSYTAVSTQGLSTGGVKHIKSLVADNQGGIWVVSGPNGNTSVPSGLYKLEGKTWRPVPVQGADLRRVVQTTFDDQGHAWVIIEGGAVLTFDGEDWTTVVAEDVSPVSSSDGDAGLFVDSHDRLWLWQYDSVHLLDKGTWTTLTEKNSGLSGGGIFGVLVDDLDRLWIASYGGVSMIPVDDIEPIREEMVNLYSLIERMNGTNWFLPSVLIILWLAVYLNSLPGVLIAAVVGMLLTYLFGAPYMKQPGYGYYVLNPGVFVTLGGMVGGLIGGQIDKDREAKGASDQHMNIVLAFSGFLLGFGCFLPYAMVTSP